MANRVRRRKGLEAPIWAPVPIDADIEDVKPLSGWVMVSEHFEQDTYKDIAGMELAIVKPGTSNTMYGELIAMSEESNLDVEIGDKIIYREWSGGRWSLNNRVVLLLPEDDVLAIVE